MSHASPLRDGAPGPATPAVSLRDLTRRFGIVVAVDRLTFDVRPGELFGLVGPDGAGKTTALRMMAGVLRPSSGALRVDGADVTAEPEAAKPRVAYMAQRFGLYDDLTVRENLDFYADLYGVPDGARAARFERLFRFSGLGGFQRRLAGALSGGMKQKLSLSCCLVHRPRILLLDEPTFGVDPISRRELWRILAEMIAEGVTVVVSTSYLDEAERCDRVALLHEGRTLALDDPDRLRNTLDGAILEVRAERPRAARDLLRADAGATGVRSASLFGDAVHAHVAPGTPPERVAELLARAGVAGAGVRAVRPSLEDVFLSRVTGAAPRMEGGYDA